VLSGQSFDIRGRLLPGEPGRVVKLQAGGTGHGWTTLTTTRTSRAGRFDLRSTAAGTGQQQLRVKFDGDRLNGRASARAGQLTVYRSSVASWYSDGGSTACGFHAGYGVANKTLPCGTKVTFSYQGRTVTAVVDDRGPFVGGREWDLNQNVANALGFNGVDTVWSSL
jgi:rare lipoprotein A (peptidoglycan hydrolase)